MPTRSSSRWPDGASLGRRSTPAPTSWRAHCVGWTSTGERLAIFSPNCAEFVDLFFGCARSGVIGAALNIRLSATEIASYLRHVEPAAVAVHAGAGRAGRALVARSPVGQASDRGRPRPRPDARPGGAAGRRELRGAGSRRGGGRLLPAGRHQRHDRHPKGGGPHAPQCACVDDELVRRAPDPRA